MGICKKCKKKTDLYCFKHKQYICAACLTQGDNEHATCYLGSYRDFLALSAEEVEALVNSNCPTCSEPLTDADKIFRLPCLHLIHQGCLEKIVSELPADTARGGFTCPKCSKPIFNSGDVSGDSLASALAARLHDLPWAAPLLATISVAQSSEEETPSSPSKTEAPSSPAPKEEASEDSKEAKVTKSVESTPAPPSSEEKTVKQTEDGKSSASNKFINMSQNGSSSHPQHQKPQARSTVATGVPGVGLFVPPPPPKPQPVDATPITGSVLSNLPLSDRVDSDNNDEEFLNIQIPPLGSRLASRKALPLGDYNRVYYDDDDEKVHHSAFIQVVNYFGLGKRVNGRLVIDRMKVVVAFAVLIFLFIIIKELFTPATDVAPTPDDE